MVVDVVAIFSSVPAYARPRVGKSTNVAPNFSKHLANESIATVSLDAFGLEKVVCAWRVSFHGSTVLRARSGDPG